MDLFFLFLRIILDPFTAPHVPLPAFPIQEMIVTGEATATSPPNAPTPLANDSSAKGKSPVQDSGVSPEELESFSVKHET